jgi:hypothetical protein
MVRDYFLYRLLHAISFLRRPPSLLYPTANILWKAVLVVLYQPFFAGFLATRPNIVPFYLLLNIFKLMFIFHNL